MLPDCGRIFELDKASRKVAQAVAGQVKHERLLAPGKPDAPNNTSAHAVVNFAFHNIFVNSTGHGICSDAKSGIKIQN